MRARHIAGIQVCRWINSGYL